MILNKNINEILIVCSMVNSQYKTQIKLLSLLYWWFLIKFLLLIYGCYLVLNTNEILIDCSIDDY